MNCCGVKQANVHSTFELANTSMGLVTIAGKFFLADAAVVFGLVSCFDSPFCSTSAARAGVSRVFLTALPKAMVLLVNSSIAGVPSGLYCFTALAKSLTAILYS